jgi:predicted nuclease with TOPRIM domain
MNLVGKILVVAVFVMSLVFAAFALSVHSTHRNWKQDAQAKAKELQDLIARRDALIAQLSDMERLLERNKREAMQRLAQLETLKADLQSKVDVTQDENAKYATQLKEAIAAADNATRVLESIRQENSQLREQNNAVKKERDDAFTEVVKLQDGLAQAQAEFSKMFARNKDLNTLLAQMRSVINDAGIQLNRKQTVTGLVQAIDQSRGLVEISVGFDDGLEVGMELDVFRTGSTDTQPQYMGRIKLTTVNPDVSVGQILKDYSKGTIQRRDHVATRLSVRAP